MRTFNPNFQCSLHYKTTHNILTLCRMACFCWVCAHCCRKSMGSDSIDFWLTTNLKKWIDYSWCFSLLKIRRLFPLCVSWRVGCAEAKIKNRNQWSLTPLISSLAFCGYVWVKTAYIYIHKNNRWMASYS